LDRKAQRALTTAQNIDSLAVQKHNTKTQR